MGKVSLDIEKSFTSMCDPMSVESHIGQDE